MPRDLATPVIVQIIRWLYMLGFGEVLATNEAALEDIVAAVVAVL
ncbi:MAG: hypothetical protein SH847_24895 [Roseiflexaceae bacterium]|nr:hypothetical protein [Roseiflexaceae bacterium]